jgi:hypothetical protein
MTFLKAMAPIAKEAGRAIGQEGIATGARVLNELVQGREAKEAIASEGQEGIKRLLDRASARMQRGSGGGGAKKRGAGNRIMIKPGDIIATHSAIKRKGPAIKMAALEENASASRVLAIID